MEQAVARGEAASVVGAVRKMILRRARPKADPRKVEAIAGKIAQSIYEYRRQIKAKGRR